MGSEIANLTMTTTALKALIHDIVDTNTSTFPDARMVRGMNVSQNKVVNVIAESDQLSEWDDDNFTDLPEGTINIVSGQRSYNLREDENFANLRVVCKVFILTSATGTDYTEIKREGKSFSTVTGVPTSYRMSGSRLVFDIEPNYSATNGIRVLFIREPQEILTSDTTKELGIPTAFHHLVALYTAYDFARSKTLDNRNDILRDVEKEEKRLGLSVSHQDNYAETVITPESVNSI
jgi:hypothetical protein